MNTGPPTLRPNETGNMTCPDIFDEFESYRFSDDPEFRAGLPTVIAAIRGQDRSADQIDEMIGRAQWFYFTRLKGVSIPWETYARRQRTHPYVDPASPKTGLVLSRTASPTASPSGLGPAPLPPSSKRPSPQEALQTLNNLAEARQMMKAASTGEDGDDEGLSFAMLSRLIAEGRTSEVPVRQIPEGTNEGQPSQATMSARPKPWEMAQAIPHYAPYTSNFAPQARGSYTTPPGTSSPFGLGLAQAQPDTIPIPYPYDVSPQMRTNTNWASPGPTISPDLGSFSLDPDMAYDPLTASTTRSSSNQVSSQQSPSNVSGSGSGPYDPLAVSSSTSLSLDDPFNAYMDFGDSSGAGPTKVNDGTSLSLPSPGVFASTSSSSTPAPTSHRSAAGGGADNTPSSSHSL